MADIVQLKENGVVKYMKIHADAIDGIEGKLVKAVKDEIVLGIRSFQDEIQIGGKSVSVNAKPTHEVVKDYWNGTGAYSTGSQSVATSNSSNAGEIILILSRYNDNGGDIVHSVPVIPNVTKLRYELPAVTWVDSASAGPTITHKRISISKSGTSLVITGDTANTLNEINRKIVFREVGAMRHKQEQIIK